MTIIDAKRGVELHREAVPLGDGKCSYDAELLMVTRAMRRAKEVLARRRKAGVNDENAALVTDGQSVLSRLKAGGAENTRRD